METITGVVEDVSIKPWTDQKSGERISLHSFTLKDVDMFWRTGRTAVSCAPGDYVQFKANGRNVDAASIEVKTQAADMPSQNATPEKANTTNQRGSGGGLTRDQYWSKREEREVEKDTRYQTVDIPRMTYSSCQQRAVDLVGVALANDGLSFGNVAKGKRLEMLLGYVDEVTDHFVAQTVSSPNKFNEFGEYIGNQVEDSPAVLEEESGYAPE